MTDGPNVSSALPYYQAAFLEGLVADRNGQEPDIELMVVVSCLAEDMKAAMLQGLVADGAIVKEGGRWEVTDHGVDIYQRFQKLYL